MAIIHRLDEGVSTHPVSTWIGGDESVIANGIGFDHRMGVLSNYQLEDLYNIID